MSCAACSDILVAKGIIKPLVILTVDIAVLLEYLSTIYWEMYAINNSG